MEQRPIEKPSEASQEAAIFFDTAGRVTHMNSAAERFLGQNRDQAISKPLAEVALGAKASQDLQLLDATLAAIVDSSDDIIVSKTLEGIITSWNKGAERVLGYTEQEAIGKHISMLVPPESLEDTQTILNKVARGEKVDHHHTKRRRKDGKIIDVSLTVSPIRDATGVITGASKVGRDVTESRQAGLLKDRLAAIVESSDDIIVSKTLDGVVTSWNKGAERILGYAASEMIGKHIALIMPPEHVEDMQKILNRIRDGEKVEHYETRRICKSGRIIDVSLTVSPIRDVDGRIVGASKIGRDITYQKQIESERQEADRRKDEFLAMLAHELRNPLASINNAVQLFGKLESEEELEWAKEIVHRQVRHLSRLIEDLLDVSRITRGKISLRREHLNLSPIVSSAVEAVRPFIEERKHEIVVSLAPGALRLEGDPMRLEQILVNLLTNSAKYTESGGRITLTAWSEQDTILVQIRDTGVGIAPELLPRIFDLFVQGDRSIARSEGGLGIGLTLVQKLAEMHDGSVVAESDGLNRGSQFTLRFPMLKAAPIAKPRLSSQLPRVARQSSRILVVDDNVDTAVGLAKLLTLLGHDVEVAYDGESALTVAAAHKPEIILMDIGLPGLTGYEVVRRLRQGPTCKTALIVAVSGYGQEDDRRKSSEAGFDHHLVKPVDLDSLVTLLA
jgi:PAS domain S-box-containing protein